jgi:ankyrin repeat protein
VDPLRKNNWVLCIEVELTKYFSVAARSGDEEIMQLLLDHKDVKKAVNVLNVEHRNAMFNCIRYGEKAAKAWLQKLIQLDADLDVEDDMGWTILIYASVFGDKSIIEAIIEGGADVNQMPSDGWNALHTVVAKNMREQAEILLDKGAHIDTPTGDDEETAFHIALRSDHIDLVRLLLKRGADTTMKTKKGQSAWDLASEHDGDDYRVIKMELLKTLKDGEIDVGIAQVAAWTTWATFGPLLKRVDWQGKSGLRERLTLTCLASDPDRQSHEMLRSRLADKVETPPVESKDWTALDWAAYLGSSDLVLW